MNEFTIGKIKISFPFEPGLPCRMSYEEYEEAKILMSKHIKKDRSIIDFKLKNIYKDMVKSEENMSVYNQLISNKDKLIYVTDGSYLFTPLVYDENSEKFYFQQSCDMGELLGWNATTTMGECVEQILEVFGGLVFRIFCLDELSIFCFSRYSKSYSGKQIKNWCDNDDSKEARIVNEKYFSEGKSLGKFIYYYLKRQKDDSLIVLRDYEKSPRQ